MKRVNFKFPDEIFNTMTFKARALNVSNTTYVKSLIMEKTIVAADTNKNYTRIIGLMGNLTNNINQIAVNLNTANKAGHLGDIDYENLINILTVIENNITKLVIDVSNQ